MTPLGLNILRSREYPKGTVYWGQSFPGLNEDPGALAGGDLEFLWCSNAPDFGITRDFWGKCTRSL